MCLRYSQFSERMATKQAWRVNCYDIQIWDEGETLDYSIRFEPALQNWAMSLVLCFAIDILALQAINKSYTRSTLSCMNSGDQDGPVCSWNGRMESMLGCTKSFYEKRRTSKSPMLVQYLWKELFWCHEMCAKTKNPDVESWCRRCLTTEIILCGILVCVWLQMPIFVEVLNAYNSSQVCLWN